MKTQGTIEYYKLQGVAVDLSRNSSTEELFSSIVESAIQKLAETYGRFTKTDLNTVLDIYWENIGEPIDILYRDHITAVIIDDIDTILKEFNSTNISYQEVIIRLLELNPFDQNHETQRHSSYIETLQNASWEFLIGESPNIFRYPSTDLVLSLLGEF